LLGKSTTRCNVTRWKRVDNSLSRNKLDRVPAIESKKTGDTSVPTVGQAGT
ncbi:hypothetical protein Tco_0070362, partial [Tanacetum coccineum]